MLRRLDRGRLQRLAAALREIEAVHGCDSPASDRQRALYAAAATAMGWRCEGDAWHFVGAAIPAGTCREYRALLRGAAIAAQRHADFNEPDVEDTAAFRACFGSSVSPPLSATAGDRT